MRQLKEKKINEEQQSQEPNLKGTLISVLLLGLFIIVAWGSIFYIFIDR
ncbi:cytochrome c oxidase subunit 2A [Virgibacillus pantothenticus]|nr:cytochrome c oxidase subunit 2A [Virgibacillus pantothenticus]MBU8567840.1 cytochrome c oxidase subunit 2A [Virgibacillus pantothenticus]MBU8601633.1 cytochrome c oxidase subunit 2A [Virgibacillus pantothenticus]MBU8635900.1 cytochrome c oxidase subunit 2A [Virgibacillus pantothenticus]MBU8641384.1 cytochrome c oxidase subunit 2A [Virgibacillus pantothenticus]MBU8646163.1 cytochrome c oxidase subunit 2A [Virgibacillus pantothenticus]